MTKSIDHIRIPEKILDKDHILLDDDDTTKRAKFEVDGISTGTIRTFTLPDSDGTLVVAGGLVDFNNISTNYITEATLDQGVQIEGIVIEDFDISAASDITFTNSDITITNDPDLVFTLRATGDATLRIDSDTDNVSENDNPALIMSQDNKATQFRLGLIGDNGSFFTDSIQNDSFIQAIGSSLGIEFAIGSSIMSRMTSSGLAIDQIDEYGSGGVTIQGINLDTNKLEFANGQSFSDTAFGLTTNVPTSDAISWTINGVEEMKINTLGELEIDTINELGTTGVTIQGINLDTNNITFDNGQSITDTASSLEISVLSGDKTSMIVNAIEVGKFDNNGLNLPLEIASRILSLDASKNVVFVPSMSAYVVGGTGIDTSDNLGVVTMSVDNTVRHWGPYASNNITSSQNFVVGMSGTLVHTTGTVTLTLSNTEGLPSNWCCRVSPLTGTCTIAISGSTLKNKNGSSTTVTTTDSVHIQRITGANTYEMYN